MFLLGRGRGCRFNMFRGFSQVFRDSVYEDSKIGSRGFRIQFQSPEDSGFNVRIQDSVRGFRVQCNREEDSVIYVIFSERTPF